MRRHGMIVVALGLPLAMFLASLARPHGAEAAPAKSGATARPAAAASASSSASAPAAAPSDDAGAPAATAGDAGAPTTAAASTGAGADKSAPPAASGMDGQTYAVRLRDLEQRVDELKDQIRRSHTRLALLSDTIVGGGSAGSRAEIAFDDEMSSAFSLRRAVFVLDGAIQYSRQDDTGALADQKEIPIFNGSVPPGDHTISVLLNFQGNGYGVFTYLRGYKFDVKSSHSFTAVEGKTLSITATALEKGGVTTPLEQRPAIEWHEKVQPIGATPTVAAPPPNGAPVSATTAGAGASVKLGGGPK